MALTQFVRNVTDLSDDGGYKFRFHCDRCNDGVESQYVASTANILKTGLQIFSMFRVFGGSRRAVEGIDRGLRGKERDQAYETAVGEATVHFSKCSHCGKWVCDHCFNARAGLCEGCAPDASEAGAREAAELDKQRSLERARNAPQGGSGPIACPSCRQASGGGKFCQSCGAALGVDKSCGGCGAQLAAQAKFCGECGKPC